MRKEQKDKNVDRIIHGAGPLKAEDLECLIRWPSGCRGEEMERKAIRSILSMMKKNGSGRVKQLVEQVCEIIDDKTVIEFHKRDKAKWLKSMGFPVEAEKQTEAMESK